YKPEERLANTRFRKLIYTGHCTAINAQLPNTIRARHGLPLLAPGEFKPWVKNCRANWAKRPPKPTRTRVLAVISALVVLAAGLRWRRLARDNKRRSMSEKT